MKTTEETKPQIVKSKQLVWRGKEYTENLTTKDIADIKQQADICKLNGWGEGVFLRNLSRRLQEDWKDEALEMFAEAHPVLAVGMGATENLYSDRRAKTIVEIISPRKIVVQENETRCLDYYAGHYEVLDTLAEYMHKSTFTLRRGGTWVEEGQPKKSGSVTLTVGYRAHYIDPSF